MASKTSANHAWKWKDGSGVWRSFSSENAENIQQSFEKQRPVCILPNVVDDQTFVLDFRSSQDKGRSFTMTSSSSGQEYKVLRSPPTDTKSGEPVWFYEEGGKLVKYKAKLQKQLEQAYQAGKHLVVIGERYVVNVKTLIETDHVENTTRRVVRESAGHASSKVHQNSAEHVDKKSGEPIWFYEEGGKLVKYKAKLQKQLEQAYQAGQHLVSIGDRYVVNIKTLIETDHEENITRRVVRRSQTSQSRGFGASKTGASDDDTVDDNYISSNTSRPADDISGGGAIAYGSGNGGTSPTQSHGSGNARASSTNQWKFWSKRAGKWIPYDATNNKKVQDAFLQDRDNVRITLLSDARAIIDFNTMIQSMVDGPKKETRVQRDPPVHVKPRVNGAAAMRDPSVMSNFGGAGGGFGGSKTSQVDDDTVDDNYISSNTSRRAGDISGGSAGTYGSGNGGTSPTHGRVSGQSGRSSTKQWKRWSENAQEWIPYDPTNNRKIQDAFRQDQDNVQITLSSGARVLIDFNTMSQSMVDGPKRERRVQRDPPVPMKPRVGGGGAAGGGHAAGRKSPGPPKWFWRDNAKAWKAYEVGINKLIESAYEAKNKSLSLKLSNGKLATIDFEDMLQSTENGKKKRPIKRDPPVQHGKSNVGGIGGDGASKNDFVDAKWLWKKDADTWCPYDAAVSDEIEKAYKRNDPNCVIELQRGIYRIEFARKWQVSADDKKRAIKRIPPAKDFGGGGGASKDKDPKWFYKYNGKWKSYVQRLNYIIEHEFKSDTKGTAKITLDDGRRVTIDFKKMRQESQDGTKREIQRRPPISPPKHREPKWFWSDNDGTWKPYGQRQNIIIEHAFENDRGTVSVSLDDVRRVTIDFKKMTQSQSNRKGRERKVKREPPPKPPHSKDPKWFWKDDEGNWTPYQVSTNHIIEHYFEMKSTKAPIKIKGRDLEIDFEKMIQRSKAGSKRDIKREPSVDAATKEKEPVWEFEKEPKKWEPFDIYGTAIIENALKTGESTVDIFLKNGRKVTVDIGRMVQITAVSKDGKGGSKERRIRRDPPIEIKWQVLLEGDKWCDYAKELVKKLDEAYFTTGDRVDVGGGRFAFPSEMIQRRDGSKRRGRPIRRKGPIALMWQFRKAGSKDRWTTFDGRATQAIESTFKDGKTSVDVKVSDRLIHGGDWTMRVNPMDGTGSHKGFVRTSLFDIRRLPRAAEKGQVRWEFQSRGTWKAFEAKDSVEIEKRFKNFRSCRIKDKKTNRTRTEVFPHLFRCVIRKTGEVQPIRRVPDPPLKWYWQEKDDTWKPFSPDDSRKIQDSVSNSSTVNIDGRSVDARKGTQKSNRGTVRLVRRVPPIIVRALAEHDDPKKEDLPAPPSVNVFVEDLIFRNGFKGKDQKVRWGKRGTYNLDFKKMKTKHTTKGTERSLRLETLVCRPSFTWDQYRRQCCSISKRNVKPHYEDVKQGDADWKRLQKRVHESLPKHFIKRIQRVVNPALEDRYDSFKQFLLGQAPNVVNEKKDLFHSAFDEKTLDIIALGSFNEGGFETRIGRDFSTYGKGAYFAHHAIYNVGIYPKRTILLVADVMLGRCKDYGNALAGALMRAPDPYLSVQGTEQSIGLDTSRHASKNPPYAAIARDPKDLENGRQYVVYSKDHAVPRFKIFLEYRP